jgi:glycogen synthase
MPRVLHVTDSFLPKTGGAEQAIDQLVRALTAQGCPSAVLAQVNRGVPTAVDVPYAVGRYRRPHSHLWAGWWIARAMAKFEREHGAFDAYVGHHAFPPGYAAVTHALARGRRAVVHIRGGDIYYGSRLRRKKLAWGRLSRALREAHAVVALSTAMRELTLEICPGARVHVIPNGIDLGAINGASEGSKFAGDERLAGPFVLGLGRAVRRKGFHVLLEAFARVRPAGWKLVIAGDGRDLAELKAQAGKLGGGGAEVVFTGLVTGADKRWLLRHCRFTCAPSLEESFPNVALEAIACGKPVLGSTAGGFADIVGDGVTGMLTPAGDAGKLAEAIRAMTAMDLAAMSRAAAESARRFDWPLVAREYAKLLTGEG